jgi:hypothetical protein
MLRCRALLPLVLVAAIASACGEPPDREIQQAQSAIEAARAAGADVYAHDEFAAAQTALKNANEAVAQRDYRLALNNALDARERAQNATKEAGERKSVARVDADHAIAAATTAITEARTRLKAAETVRAAPRVVAEARRTIAGVEQAVQKARTAHAHEDYAGAIQTANAATARLQGVARDLDAASAAPVRRRR